MRHRFRARSESAPSGYDPDGEAPEAPKKISAPRKKCTNCGELFHTFQRKPLCDKCAQEGILNPQRIQPTPPPGYGDPLQCGIDCSAVDPRQQLFESLVAEGIDEATAQRIAGQHG